MKRALLLAGVLLWACGHDAANTAYFQALAGEKTGVPCSELLSLVDRAIALRPACASSGR